MEAWMSEGKLLIVREEQKKSKRSYVGGGTFSANPGTMTAGFSTLNYLKKNRGSLYPKITHGRGALPFHR